jgi:hypothetical protein
MFKITEKPAWLSTLSDDAQSRLSRNNQLLREGSDNVVISPAMKDVEDSEIEGFVKGTFDSGLYTEKLIEIENSNLSKLGPRSIALPWAERRASLEAYFTDESLLSEGDFREWAIEFQSRYSINGRLHPVSLDTVAKNLEPSSASGLPYMVKKGIVRERGQLTEEFVDVYPCVIYTRTQEGGKTRNVMGVGISDVIREMRYHQAFLPTEKKLSWRAAIVSPDEVDLQISTMLNMRLNDETVTCLDFSAYDASISPYQSGRAFAFIASHFATKFWWEIYSIYERFATIPFYTPDGEYSGNHGVPSGSAFTNTIDSIVQFLIAVESKLASPDGHGAQIQGDDGIYLIGDNDVDAFTESFRAAGLSVNTDKSDFFKGTEGTYLQRYYHTRYYSNARRFLGGVYSIGRALLRLKYLERFIDGIGNDDEISGRDYFSLRAITILENCKYHPHFHDLIDFVQSRDKTSLSYSGTGLKAFANHPSRRSRADITNQYGDQGGIESFETVKYLQSKGTHTSKWVK